MLCYQCGHSSHQIGGAKRAIVTCDHCNQHWHLDCLSPPLANPPALNKDGKKVHDWMCPLHIDQALRQVDVSSLNRATSRQIHVRKPKNPVVAETALSRGHRNNGIIEVLDDQSDGSDSEFYDHEEDNKVYRLPATGIKLDFIDKIKQYVHRSVATSEQQGANVHTVPAYSNFVTRVHISDLRYKSPPPSCRAPWSKPTLRNAPSTRNSSPSTSLNLLAIIRISTWARTRWRIWSAH